MPGDSKNEVETLVLETLVEMGAEPEGLTRDSALEDLEVDSLDIVELCQIVEDKFGITTDPHELKVLRTVGQAIDAFVARLPQEV